MPYVYTKQNKQFEEKKNTRKYNVGVSLGLRIENGVLCEDPTQLNLQLSKGKLIQQRNASRNQSLYRCKEGDRLHPKQEAGLGGLSHEGFRSEQRGCGFFLAGTGKLGKPDNGQGVPATGLERLSHETVKIKPGLCRRPQHLGDARAMGHCYPTGEKKTNITTLSQI